MPVTKPTTLVVKPKWQIDLWKHESGNHLTIGDDLHMNGIDAPVHLHTRRELDEFIQDLRAAAQVLPS